MHRDLKLANILVHFPITDFKVQNITNLAKKAELIKEKLKIIDLLNENI